MCCKGAWSSWVRLRVSGPAPPARGPQSVEPCTRILTVGVKEDVERGTRRDHGMVCLRQGT
jgi:hypothetical protein